MSAGIDDLKEEEKARLHEAVDGKGEDAGRHHRHSDWDHSNNWIAGVVLILVGSLFLLSNVFSFRLDNWWAFFILIPVFANFGNAWRQYQRDGRISSAVRGPIIGGIILLFIFSIFIFGWNWGVVWPVFFIIFGISALLGAMDK